MVTSDAVSSQRQYRCYSEVVSAKIYFVTKPPSPSRLDMAMAIYQQIPRQKLYVQKLLC